MQKSAILSRCDVTNIQKIPHSYSHTYEDLLEEHNAIFVVTQWGIKYSFSQLPNSARLTYVTSHDDVANVILF